VNRKEACFNIRLLHHGKPQMLKAVSMHSSKMDRGHEALYSLRRQDFHRINHHRSSTKTRLRIESPALAQQRLCYPGLSPEISFQRISTNGKNVFAPVWTLNSLKRALSVDLFSWISLCCVTCMCWQAICIEAKVRSTRDFRKPYQHSSRSKPMQTRFKLTLYHL